MPNINMRNFMFAGITVAVSVFFAASCSSSQKATETNVSKANSTDAQHTDRVPLAIRGYDPVAFFTVGRPMRGVSEIEVEREGMLYRFSSEENRQAFAKDPSLYVPQFGDYCAMALSKGELVAADPENWLIVEGKLYVFGKPTGVDLFQQDLAGNVLKANRNRSLLPKP
ncbi:MAG: YHS domain-containing (seleno)protein [Pyrinomonadaceae bacterium]